jgi:hypothetical protein
VPRRTSWVQCGRSRNCLGPAISGLKPSP